MHQQLMTSTEATIDEAAATPDGRPSSGSSPRMKVELVEGSGPQLTYETQCLLQRRLRAAAIVIALGTGLYLIRRLFVEMGALELHIAEFVVSVVLLVLLGRRHCLSMKKLRAMELVLFGLGVVMIAAVARWLVLRHVEQNPRLALPALKCTVLYFFAFMTIYGTFIPNTWRRAAAMVVPVSLGAWSLSLVFLWQFPSIAQATPRAVIIDELSDNALMLLMGVLCSVYGTHVVNRLRTEAFQARRFGRYRLKQLLGAGGMGEVYLAEHELLKRPCAIKLIRPDKAADPTALVRFEREVRATAGLSHPNTIDIYDYGRTDDGTFYYVMEYLPGLNLAELVDRHGPLPPEQAMGEGEPDARSDIYSLAAVAYFALTTRPPFENAKPMKVLVAHARDPVVPPSELRSDVPADLEAVLLRCLAKDPSERLQDASALESALAQCAAADQWSEVEAANWWMSNVTELIRQHPTIEPSTVGSV